ncbi:MAG: hypothetical protein K6E73_00290 [Bacteroidales bacterium]|nr:hypothetical protein [Bacteroidales bacterium]
MKKAYFQPEIEVYDLSSADLLAVSSYVPGGGEIPIGGVGSADASAYRRGTDWDTYENRR